MTVGRVREDSLGGLERTVWEDWREQLERVREHSRILSG